MSDLSKEQLQEFFDAIMERMQEFELPMPSSMMLTKGAVRVAYDVIAPFVRGQMTPVREEAEDKPRERNASERLASTLGVEHVVVTPLRSQEDDGEALSKWQADFDAIIKELKHLAMGGIMPSMSTWDASRLGSLPKAQALINRFQKGWKELADIAGLRVERSKAVRDGLVHINGTWNEGA